MKKYVIAILAFFFLCGSAFAATYYVTENGGGLHDGSDPDNAFNESEHNSSTFSRDDTIYIYGTVTGEIIPPSNGTLGHPIIYRGDYPDHPGKIDKASLVSGECIEINAKSYIEIIDIECEGGYTGIQIYNSIHVSVKGSTVHHNGRRGIRLENSDYNTIGGYGTGNTLYDCDYGDPGNSSSSNITIASGSEQNVISYNTSYNGTDGIMSDPGHYNLIEFNTFYGHYEDGIDIKDSTHTIVRFNHCYNNTQMGIQIQNDSQYVYAYGNYSHDNKKGMTIKDSDEDSGSGTRYIYVWANILAYNDRAGLQSSYETGDNGLDEIYIYNNTIAYNGESQSATYDTGLAFSYSGCDYYAKNNIFLNNRNPEADKRQAYYNAGTFHIDTNYYWSGSATQDIIYYDGSDRTLSYVQGYGIDSNSTEADPLLTNPTGGDYTLSGSSPCEDAGEDLSGLVGSEIINGNTYNLYWQIALQPDTNWSTTPPTVLTTERGTFDLGAYESTDDDIVVTVTVSDAAGAEEGQDQFTYTVACSPDCNATAISLLFSGAGQAAQIDVDFNCDHESNITITGSSDTVTCTPVDDGLAEGSETAYLSLGYGSGYALGTPYMANAEITDNDQNKVTFKQAGTASISNQTGTAATFSQ